jgi:hypothetical protein
MMVSVPARRLVLTLAGGFVALAGSQSLFRTDDKTEAPGG